jgi:hypothetical protein
MSAVQRSHRIDSGSPRKARTVKWLRRWKPSTFHLTFPYLVLFP